MEQRLIKISREMKGKGDGEMGGGGDPVAANLDQGHLEVELLFVSWLRPKQNWSLATCEVME